MGELRSVYCEQGWGEYYSGTRLVQNDKHEYTKNTVLEYYSSTDFPVLVLVCSVLAPALIVTVSTLGPWGYESNFKSVIADHMSQNNFMNTLWNFPQVNATEHLMISQHWLR